MSMSPDPATDPLWDPRVPADEELRQLERLLAPYAATRRPALLAPPLAQPPARTERRRWLFGLATAASLMLSLWGAHHYRLAWPEGQPWPLRSGAEQRLLAPGERLQTGGHEHAELSVARVFDPDPGAAGAIGLFARARASFAALVEAHALHPGPADVPRWAGRLYQLPLDG